MILQKIPTFHRWENIYGTSEKEIKGAIFVVLIWIYESLVLLNIISLGNVLFPMQTAEWVHLGVKLYHNSQQNIIILFWKYFVVIRSEAWLNVCGNTSMENCLQCLTSQTCATSAIVNT
jgi:hypothetical protein